MFCKPKVRDLEIFVLIQKPLRKSFDFIYKDVKLAYILSVLCAREEEAGSKRDINQSIVSQ